MFLELEFTQRRPQTLTEKLTKRYLGILILSNDPLASKVKLATTALEKALPDFNPLMTQTRQQKADRKTQEASTSQENVSSEQKKKDKNIKQPWVDQSPIREANGKIR